MDKSTTRNFEIGEEAKPLPLGGHENRIPLLQKKIDQDARALRASISVRLASSFLSAFSEATAAELVHHSPFRDHVETYSGDCPLLALSFTLTVTRIAIEAVLQQELPAATQLYLCSRIAELGVNAIQDPRDPQQILKFLGASKQHGYFFTPPEIATLIARLAIGDRTRIQKAIDPAAGCGALIGALLLEASERGAEIAEIQAIEQDSFTAELLKKIIDHLIKRLRLMTKFSIQVGDAIAMYGRSEFSDRTYDCIVMNPPYGRIKFLKNILTNQETRVSVAKHSLGTQEQFWRDRVRQQTENYRHVAEEVGISGGSLDYQRIFIGIAQNLMTHNARCVFISPSTWFGDRDGLELRRKIILGRMLEVVYLFPENTGLFATVSQPTGITCLSPGDSPDSILINSVVSGRALTIEDSYSIEVDTLIKLDPDLLRIPRVSHAQHDICVHLQELPRLKEIPWVKNARGELDQTQGKEFLRLKPTSLRLVRGDHIERFILRKPETSALPSYVDPKTYAARYRDTPKYADTQQLRLAGRQCSYIQKGRRLSFSIVPAGVVLGNSCNYLRVIDAPVEEKEAIAALAVLLNSSVVEWYFRIYSGNNHVSNYEIDDFPVCLQEPGFIGLLAVAGEFLACAYQDSATGGKIATPMEDFADALVAWGYGLTKDQTLIIFNSLNDNRGSRVAGMVDYLYKHGVPANLLEGEGWHQHVAPSLSALDREIIHYVPQGGNWMDIPDTVPSQRLEQIRKMSEWRGVVRTTYYGRLRPDQPAYTIATYYNRPGNGTNIHPWADRTLTNREAARLQSFPDWYHFLGTDSTVRKQIGNAVPPLLGYAVARHLAKYTGGNSVIDLFAGAGGLSLGLELAGLPVAVAVEYDRNIGLTYCFNRDCESTATAMASRTLFLQADLSDIDQKRETIQAIKQKLKGKKVGAVIGGPPCQGFSHAGWRSADDSRNNLAVVFLEFVEALKPSLVVLENVEGLLTFDKGRVIADLQKALMDLGYSVGTRPWILNAEQYGVPQMRRRVFLVGIRGSQVPEPPPVIFEKCKGRRESLEPRGLFESLPYPVTAGEALYGLPPLMDSSFPIGADNHYRHGFNRWIKGIISIDEMLAEYT